MRNLLFAVRPLAMDLIATLVFVAVSAATHSPIVATLIAVAAGVGQILWLLLRGRKISAMQWMSLALVAVFGGATLLTQNARFMMFKPTIIYVLVGAAMLQRGWMLAYLPPNARGPGPDLAMTRWGYVWAGLMFATAAANIVFALTASFAAWSSFIAIFPLVSKFVLFGVQFASVRAVAVRQRRAARAALAEAPLGAMAGI